MPLDYLTRKSFKKQFNPRNELDSKFFNLYLVSLYLLSNWFRSKFKTREGWWNRLRDRAVVVAREVIVEVAPRLDALSMYIGRLGRAQALRPVRGLGYFGFRSKR